MLLCRFEGLCLEPLPPGQEWLVPNSFSSFRQYLVLADDQAAGSTLFLVLQVRYYCRGLPWWGRRPETSPLRDVHVKDNWDRAMLQSEHVAEHGLDIPVCKKQRRGRG